MDACIFAPVCSLVFSLIMRLVPRLGKMGVFLPLVIGLNIIWLGEKRKKKLGQIPIDLDRTSLENNAFAFYEQGLHEFWSFQSLENFT